MSECKEKNTVFADARQRSLAAICALFVMALCSGRGAYAKSEPGYDVIVIGGGIAGISAALEASERGARVLVVDMNSMPGGHAIMSSGGIFIVGSPLQKEFGFEDSPDLAYKEWIAYGEDADREWARYYVDHCLKDVYHWLESQGVKFVTLMHVAQDGNSVARHHIPEGSGRGLTLPLIRKLFSRPNIEFRKSTFATELITRNGQVVGLRAIETRTGRELEIFGRAIVIATGGFASNLKMVERYWPAHLPWPAHALAGSGVNSQGYGHAMAEAIGAELKNMDHHWIYPTGVPHPLRLGTDKGIEVLSYHLWVDGQGDRFKLGGPGTSHHVETMLKLDGQSFWSLLDSTGKEMVFVTGSDWMVDREAKYKALFENEDLVKKADTIETLAQKMGVSEEKLRASIDSYNEQSPLKIESPPYYAIKHFPLVRKTMGGIRTNLKSQAIDKESKVIPGLYAAGAAAGFGGGGINGKKALEGTFLGPCVLTGRVAGRSAAEEALRLKAIE